VTSNPKPVSLTVGFGLSFKQSEVDFVIPDLAVDRPLCIDPFLLYKSKDQALKTLHEQLLLLFQRGIVLYDEGKLPELYTLLDFPEVNEIGFGYTERSIRGSGLSRRRKVLDQAKGRPVRRMEVDFQVG
jgi:hypothetical protein